MENSDKTARHPVFAGVEMGIGTWAWGDRYFWGYGQNYNQSDIRDAFSCAVNNGITFFDTAEVYGIGQSETMLGQFCKQVDVPIQVASKCFPFPWRLNRRALHRALKGSLKRLGMDKLDLYQMHFPYPPVNIRTWMSGMAEAVHAGWIGAVGVSNYNRAQTQLAYDALAAEGIPLASNQMEYHLLNRKIEKDGLLQHCLDLGVTVIAYSPLASGILTGKYSAQNLPGGFRSGRYNHRSLSIIKPLVDLLVKIGADHAGKSAAQVAINWTICKGTVPIPGGKSLQQVEQNIGALGWRLTDEEVDRLDQASDRVLKTLGW